MLIISKSEILPENVFNKSYIDKDTTTMVNGIFVIMIPFGHFTQYIELSGILDDMYLIVFHHLNQMVVATFLFYSGYGMMESIKNKGTTYIKKIPVKFLKLLFKFDTAVLLYLVLDLILGYSLSVKYTFLAFICWESIGNSNWYIFVILCVYILIFISFYPTQKINNKQKSYLIGTVILIILTLLFILLIMQTGRPMYWYNTVILVPLGFLYSIFKNRVEKIITKNNLNYLTALVLSVGVYILSFFKRFDYGIEGYTVWAVSFIALVILITLKVKIRSNFLMWFGNRVFSIYILQRIPMIVLQYFGFTFTHKYMCMIIVFVVTVLLSVIFEEITEKIIHKCELLISKK